MPSAVKVFVRTRPTGAASESFGVQPDKKTLNINLKKNEFAGLINNQQESIQFKYDSILQNMSQEGVFGCCAHEVVDNVLSGYNGTIFAYGQTGAGKTYTMSGDTANYQQRGVVPRAIHHIFREIDLRVEKEVVVRCSYLEIYNEVMYDLLADEPVTADNLVIVEEQGVTKVKGMAKKLCSSEAEALAFFFLGESNRATAAHTLNKSSSRSHCVFTIYLEIRPSGDSPERVTNSKLNLVDLAGSERTKKTQVTGQTLKEAVYINKSLTFLEQTVNALSKHEQHVPFRQSKLTGVLRDALGGNCKTVMIACIWPEDLHLEETVSTLRFASRVRTLTTNAIINESNDPSVMMRKYQRQIAELKQELAMRDTFAGRGAVSYEDFGEVERQELNVKIRNFLAGDVGVDDIPVESLKQVKEAFKQFKVVHIALRQELQEEMKSQPGATGVGSQADTAAIPSTDQYRDGDGSEHVGNEEASAGFHIGEAPATAHPPPEAAVTTMSGITPERGSAANSAVVVQDRNSAFLGFKQNIAPGKAAQLREKIQELREKRAVLRDKCTEVNAAKHEIDRLQIQVEQMAAPIGDREIKGGEGIVDSEHYKILQDLKLAKTTYRKAFDEVKELRTSLEPIAAAIQDWRAQLVEDFQVWYAKSSGAISTNDGEQDGALDYAEQFEQLEIARILQDDPESNAFHTARKTLKKLPKKAPAGRMR